MSELVAENVLINAEGLSLIRGQRLLFKQLSFRLQVGEAIYLSGHNGSGKTSLFKLLTGALSPDAGQLTILGKPSHELAAEDYQQLLYLGHQTAIKHELSVVENLRLNATVFDRVQPNDTEIAAALSAVGLSKFSAQFAGKLSAGQKRRVMLARLWLVMNEAATQKKLWLLDEPLTALDVDAIDVLQAQIDQHLSLGGGVIFTSHQAFQLSHPIRDVRLGALAGATA